MDMVTKPRALQYVAFGEDGASKAGGSRAATFLLFREQLLAARSYARNPAVLAEWGNDAMIQRADADALRSEEHTSELQSLMRISYAVFCLKKKNTNHNRNY